MPFHLAPNVGLVQLPFGGSPLARKEGEEEEEEEEEEVDGESPPSGTWGQTHIWGALDVKYGQVLICQAHVGFIRHRQKRAPSTTGTGNEKPRRPQLLGICWWA